MRRIVFLFVLFYYSAAIFAQCTMANYMAALRIPLASYPYTSVSSGVTVSVTTVNVPTLGDFSYTCGGNTYSGASPAWWLNSATGIITFSFSAPVTNLTVLINGVNSTEVFYYVPNTGAVTLSNFCTTGYTSVGGTLTAGATAGLGSIVTINNPTGATSYVLTHNGLGSGSRVTLLDCFVKLAPLPVELNKFTSQCRSKETVELNWSTSSETGNDFFAVEKSNDAIHFFEIAKVKGAGTSFSVKNYSYRDASSGDKVSYYRLRQTDISSNYKYSEIITQTGCLEKGNGEIFIYPNPALNEVIIKSENDHGMIAITDMMGVIVNEKLAERGENKLDISFLLPGTYTVKFISENSETRFKKLVISTK